RDRQARLHVLDDLRGHPAQRRRRRALGYVDLRRGRAGGRRRCLGGRGGRRRGRLRLGGGRRAVARGRGRAGGPHLRQRGRPVPLRHGGGGLRRGRRVEGGAGREVGEELAPALA